MIKFVRKTKILVVICAALASFSGSALATCGQTQMEVAQENAKKYKLNDPPDLLSDCALGSVIGNSSFFGGLLGSAFQTFLKTGVCGATSHIKDVDWSDVGIKGAGSDIKLNAAHDMRVPSGELRSQGFAGREGTSLDTEQQSNWDELYDLYK